MSFSSTVCIRNETTIFIMKTTVSIYDYYTINKILFRRFNKVVKNDY